MGFAPNVINEMTLWEFACCAEGFRQMHATEEAVPPMSAERAAALGIAGF